MSNVPILVLDSVDSTISWARTHLSLFSQDSPTCIVAREQTQGRGQYGHLWVSPKDQNIYFTLVEKLKPPFSLLHYEEVAALAVKDLLWDWQLASNIKWPNDILVDGKKIAGIVAEGTSHEGTSWAILGIGLNVNMSDEALHTIDRPATSMRASLGPLFSLKSIQKALQEKLLELLSWAKNNPEDCHKRWRDSCAWIIGTPVSVHAGPGKKISGIAHGINEEGKLLIKTASGDIVPVTSAPLA